MWTTDFPQQLLMAALTQPVLRGLSSECDLVLPTRCAIFGQWSIRFQAPDSGNNSPANAVIRHHHTALLQAASTAMNWPKPNIVDIYLSLVQQGLADSDEQPPWLDDLGRLQTDLGFFVSDSEIGFRGSSFRSALAWEYALVHADQPGNPPTEARILQTS